MASPPHTPPRSVPDYSRHLINKQWWNEVTPVHARSRFYDVEGFLRGEPALDDLELAGLGDLSGKSVLHLQCHFGLSTLDIARRGAASVVGVDLSDESIRTADALTQKTGLTGSVRFVCCDVLELDRHLDQQFDIVFTSYGAITWLCDLNRWGKIVARFLKPQGRFFIVEIHPALMMFEWEGGEIKRLFDYFHNPDGVVIDDHADYADSSYFAENSTLEWQWSLSDIFKALTRAGLHVHDFEEYPYCCFAPFPNMEQRGKMYCLPDTEKQLPMLFSLHAKK